MPGFTPNFAIEYPCAGETIDAGVFQTFADDVESALASVAAQTQSALERPNTAVRASGTSTAAGVNTQIVLTSADFQTNISVPGGNIVVPTEDGIYMVTLEAGSTTTTTSVTSWAAEIRLAGATVYRRKMSPSPALTSARTINVSGPLICLAGQNIDFSWQWTGAGINIVVIARATVCKISDL